MLVSRIIHVKRDSIKCCRFWFEFSLQLYLHLVGVKVLFKLFFVEYLGLWGEPLLLKLSFLSCRNYQLAIGKRQVAIDFVLLWKSFVPYVLRVAIDSRAIFVAIESSHIVWSVYIKDICRLAEQMSRSFSDSVGNEFVVDWSFHLN